MKLKCACPTGNDQMPHLYKIFALGFTVKDVI